MICSIDSLLPQNPKCLIFNVDQQPIVVMLKRILFLHLTMRERSSEFCPSIETLLTNECVYCPIYDLDAELGEKMSTAHSFRHRALLLLDDVTVLPFPVEFLLSSATQSSFFYPTRHTQQLPSVKYYYYSANGFFIYIHSLLD